MKKLIPAVSLSLAVALTFSACETSGGSALAGAATGAAIGGLLHGSGSDALTGAAIGAGAGYLIGKVARREREAREERYYRERGYDDRDREYYDGLGETRYPVGRRTNRTGIVTSPYRPFNLIDVRGIPRGAQVVDPSCERVFINP